MALGQIILLLVALQLLCPQARTPDSLCEELCKWQMQTEAMMMLLDNSGPFIFTLFAGWHLFRPAPPQLVSSRVLLSETSSWCRWNSDFNARISGSTGPARLKPLSSRLTSRTVKQLGSFLRPQMRYFLFCKSTSQHHTYPGLHPSMPFVRYLSMRT